MPETTSVELRHAGTATAAGPGRPKNDIAHPAIDSPSHPLAALWKALWDAEGSRRTSGH